MSISVLFLFYKRPATASRGNERRFVWIMLGLCLCLCLPIGCSSREETRQDQKQHLLDGVTLRLAVVDDPALAATVRRLQGEWNAQTGGELQIEERTETELIANADLPFDAVLCPSHLLGVLAERGLLTPLPEQVLQGRQWGGLFDLLRLREAAWGADVVGVPFGSPVLCCYYRADLLEKLSLPPPRTWEEYQSLASRLAEQKPESAEKWCGAIEPLAPGWAGLTLLARAAPYAKHRDNYSTLFNIETMEPLVAGPPFVRALEELVEAAKSGPAEEMKYDPASAREAFWRGECGIALSWPTAAVRIETPPDKANPIRVGFAELPGSKQVFNPSKRLWENRSEDDDRRVPLLGVAGRMGAVLRKSAQRDAAFQLLLWLSDDRMSEQVSASSPATTLFRLSNVQSPGGWVEKPVPAAAAVEYAEATEAALKRESWLGALPLAGRADYLAALDEAVAAAISGEKSPLDALLQAGKKWREITERLGAEKQRAAYRHSLGLD